MSQPSRPPSAPATAPARSRDPVCGMEVDPATAAGSHVHQGVTYYFCNLGCLERFRQDPAAYLTGADRPRSSAPALAEMPSPEAGTWTCPMHPEIVRTGPGACPICGMALEPRTASPLDEGDEPRAGRHDAGGSGSASS